MNPTSFDYEEAVQACADGDKQALRRLYDQECRWLLGVAMRIVRERQLAEDVVQDAFIQIWQRAETFRENRGSARGWIYTIVRHRALDEVRKPGFSRMVDVEDVGSLVWSTEQASDNRDIADTDKLERCLQLLEPDRRECIESAFLEGYTQTELAARLGKPVGTIKSWIRRGLLALRECLQ